LSSLLTLILFLLLRPPPTSTLFPYTTLFRSRLNKVSWARLQLSSDTPSSSSPNPPMPSISWEQFLKSRVTRRALPLPIEELLNSDRKSTRLNSSHVSISYAVFCLKKKKKHSL